MSDVDVLLLRRHEHGQQWYEPGDVLTVSEALADWLEKNGTGTTGDIPEPVSATADNETLINEKDENYVADESSGGD